MVDRTSGVPAFRQVAGALRAKIAAGTYVPGSKLPSERELVDTYAVSRPTVRDAVNLLRAEGIVVAEHGRGVFVRTPTTMRQRVARDRLTWRAREQGRAAFLFDAAESGFTPSADVAVRFEYADDRVAQILEIPEGEEITVRERVMRADGVAVELSVSRLPRILTKGTQLEEANTGKGGTYARLEDTGDRIGQFTETVGARMPSPEEISQLQIRPGIPVIMVTRVAYREDGTPLEMNDMVLPADRHQLSYDWDAE